MLGFDERLKWVAWICLDRPQHKSTLLGEQVGQNRVLLWFVEQQMGRLFLGCDFNCRMSSKLWIAFQDHRFANWHHESQPQQPNQRILEQKSV